MKGGISLIWGRFRKSALMALAPFDCFVDRVLTSVRHQGLRKENGCIYLHDAYVRFVNLSW